MSTTPALNLDADGTVERERPCRSPQFRWTTALYIWLALVTGAVSFQRKLPVAVAAEWQHSSWDAIASRGRVFRLVGDDVTLSSDRQDLNLVMYAQRPLLPILLAGIVRFTGLPWPYAFSALRLLSIVACYLAFDAYLRRWVAQPLAILGTLLLVATIPLTFKDWWEIPTDFPEILFLTLGLACISSERYLMLVLVTGLATLNRPTGFFLPLLLLLSCGSFGEVRSRVRPLILCSLVYLGLTALIFWWMTFLPSSGLLQLAFSAPSHALAGLLRAPHPYNNFFYYGYLFGPLWLLPFFRPSHLPHLLARALLIAPVHVVVAFFGGAGRIDEPRQLCLLFPILIPAAVVALWGTEDSTVPQ